MTTAVAMMNEATPMAATDAAPGIRALTMEEIAWVSGAECDADVCITVTLHGLSSVDWGDAIAWGAGGAVAGAYGGGLIGGLVGALAGAGASILSDIVDIHVETGSS